MEVVGEAIDGAEAVRMARELKPDVLTLNLAAEEVSGSEVLQQVANFIPPVRTILLTRAANRQQNRASTSTRRARRRAQGRTHTSSD